MQFNIYKSLMGTALLSKTAVSKSIMKQGQHWITLKSQQMASCLEITKMKVNDVLCSTGNDKAPEVDALASDQTGCLCSS